MTLVAVGTAPTIVISSGGNAAITLGQNNTVEGLKVDTTAGSGIGISDGSHTVGTLTMADINVSTASGAGINLTNGGTVTVTGANNTINSTTGIALNITNTNIGSGNVTFKSISSNGAVDGIVLNNTGSSGALIIAGDGGSSSNHSGGQILGSTNAGVVTSIPTSNVSLNYINIETATHDGIHGDSVNNLTLNHDNVLNNGTTSVDEGLQLGEASGNTVGATGAISITNSSISGSALNNVHIRDTSARSSLADGQRRHLQ